MTTRADRQPLGLIDRVLKTIHPIGLGAPSITLLQPIGKNELLIRPEVEMPEGLLKAVRAVIRKAAGPDTVIKVLGADSSNPMTTADGDLIIERGGYRLSLVPTLGAGRPIVTTAKAAAGAGSRWETAAEASKVFKRGVRPTIPYMPIRSMLPTGIAKRDTPYERIVTGVVLEPGVIDGTRVPIDPDDPNSELTAGDTYSEDDIRRGMYWWMENARESYALHHVEQGGTPLSISDVGLLENWQTRADIKLGDQLVPRGTWCQSNRIYKTSMGEKLWQAVLRGEIRSWSIGAQAMARLEELNSSIPEAGSTY